MTSKIQTLTLIIFQLLTLSFSAAAAGDVDPLFNPGLIQVAYAGNPTNGTTVRRAVVQPDGKVVLAGRFGAAHKSAANNIVRLNPDGSVDPSFRAPVTTTSNFITTEITALALQSDGKILIGGNFITVAGVSRPGIARLNSDGSVDPTFMSADAYHFNTGVVLDIEVGADNKITFGGHFIYGNVGGGQKFNLARTFADGSLDSSLDPTGIILPNGPDVGPWVYDILLLPDGKTLFTRSSEVVRLNAAGAVEFSVPTNHILHRFARQTDGKILVAGEFTTFNGFPVPAGIVRLNTNDSIDTSFTPPALAGGMVDVELLSGGKVLLTGNFSTASTKDLILLNSDGTADNSFSYAGATLVAYDAAVQLDGKIVVGAQARDLTGYNPPLARVAANGSLDPLQVVVGNKGKANDILIQPDGRLLIGGKFTHADSGFRSNIARLNADGLFDSSFTTNYFSNEVIDLDMQGDNVLVGADGGYAKLDGAGIAQFGAAGVTYDLDALPNGQILAGVNNILKRMNANGTNDASFLVNLNSSIRRILVQPDGKILIGGFFTQVNGSPRSRIARLNADGTLDPTFDPNLTPNGLVAHLALQPDGKIIIAGQFTGINFDTNYHDLARVNANGTLDTSFHSNTQGEVTSLRRQPDGKIIVGGVGIVSGIARDTLKRYNTDGSVDATLSAVMDGPVRDIALQDGNRILIGGEFTNVNGIDRLGLARLSNNVQPTAPFDYDGDGKADVSVFRASENKWYVLRSSDSAIYQPVFGIAGDIPVPADFDGDRKTDVAIYRPSSGQWWYQSSINGAQIAATFGSSGDIPRPSDFDGDGRADLVLFRPSTSTWLRFGSTAGSVPNVAFGLAGDQPLIGDFDGDGRSDLAIFRPSNGDWWYSASSAGGAFRNVHWGQTGDLPVPADFDGDSKTDFAVYRPSDGGWYIYNSGDGSFTTTAFGTSSDRPVAGDYDGDGRADIAIFRPSGGLWYLLRSTSGFAGLQFGLSTDTPTPNSFVP